MGTEKNPLPFMSFRKYIGSVREMVDVLLALVDLYARDFKISEKELEETIYYYAKMYPDLLFENKEKLILRKSIENRIGKQRMTIIQAVLKKVCKKSES